MTTQATSAQRTAKRTSNGSNTRSQVTNRTANEPKHVSEVIPEAVEEIKKTRTAKQEEARRKREELKALSNMLKKAVQTAQIEPSEDGTINGLIKEVYAQQGHTELHTFNEWKERGYIVRKGQKALLLWGKPRQANKADEAADNETDQADKNEANEKDDFFPVCYVFSNLQVHAISN